MSEHDESTEAAEGTEAAAETEAKAEEAKAEEAKSPEEAVEKPSRRKFIVGAGVGAAVAAGAIYGGSKLLQGPEATEIVSARIDDEVPYGDPDSSLWKKGPSARVGMTGQTQWVPMKDKPAVGSIRVRSVNNGDRIGFLLEWGDETESDLSIKTEQFRDSCAVMLLPAGVDQNLRIMASPSSPGTILHWRADWERDVEDGFQDLGVAFPNGTFDFYPPLVSNNKEGKPVKVPDDYITAGATYRIAGYAAKNPLSLMDRRSPVEKLIAESPGTLASLPTQDAVGKGIWKAGKWKVAIAKNLKATDEKEMALSPGGEYSVGFAIWTGAAADVGCRKTPSKLLLNFKIEEAKEK